MKSLLIFAICLFAAANSWTSVAAQTKSAQQNKAIATKLESTGEEYRQTLHITVGGERRKIPNDQIVNVSRLINDGRDVVYSVRGGAGGFENEGQSIEIYNVETAKTRQVLSEYYLIDEIHEAKLGDGKRALLVKMSDGFSGTQHFAVVDTARGQVFRREKTKLLKRSGDSITVATYDEKGWDVLLAGTEPEKRQAKPVKIERFDLKSLLKRKVIRNKREQR